MNKEIIFDKILKKFEGNKTFDWDYIHHMDFYQDIDANYFVVENHLNFLIGDGVLQEDKHEGLIWLSRKGWFVMTNSDTEGYRAKKKKENKKKVWTIILGIVSISTFILVIIRFTHDFVILPKSKSNIEIVKPDTTNQSTLPLTRIVDTTSTIKQSHFDTEKYKRKL